MLRVHKSLAVDPLALLQHMSTFHFHWLLFSPTIFLQGKSLINPNLTLMFMPPISPFPPHPSSTLKSWKAAIVYFSVRREKKKICWSAISCEWYGNFATWEFGFENASKRNNSLEMCDLDECDLWWHEWEYCCGRLDCGCVWEFKNWVLREKENVIFLWCCVSCC